jgi:hypothetical protein
VNNLQSGERVTATLGTGGPTVMFIMNADGTGSADVSATVLSAIPPGALTVTVQAGSKSLKQSVHIYVPASFMDSAKATLNTGARQPTWVQISQGHVFSTLDNATDKRINEYQVSGTTLSLLGARDTHLGLIPSGVSLDVSDTQTVRLYPQGGMSYSLDYADLASTSSTYAPLKTLTYSKTYGVVVDRKSTMAALVGEGSDGPLKVYTLPPMGQQTAVVTVSGAPSGKQPVLLGWGMIDNDQRADLVAVHADSTFAVYLQKDGPVLQYDDATSMALQKAAGLSGTPLPTLAVGDVDRDGLDDVLLLSSGQIVQLSNEGNGTFSKTSLLGVVADSLAVGDVNGDGKADLALGQKTGSTLLVYTNLSQ